MKKIQDDRVRFYLNHQALIDQWAALAKLVPEQLHEFMGGLEPELEKIAQDPEVELYSILDGPDARKLFLHRSAWHRAEADAPRVGIGLEWGKRASFAGSSVPYVGVWVNESESGSEELSQSLKARLKKLDHDYTIGSSISWIAYRYVRPPNDKYWDDLEPFCNTLLEAAKNTWEQFSPQVDAALVPRRLPPPPELTKGAGGESP